MKLNSGYILFSYLLCSILFVGCASTGSPSGGPEDTDAPIFVQEKSDQNYATNFTPNEIKIYFDEWIELKNQNKEILISPPFFKKPKITSRGKWVKIEFPEEEPLRPDATYTINFGRSIVDFTVGNPAEGFKYIFATGDQIDSLKFSGNVIDAETDEPIKDVIVMLYDELRDSIVMEDKPFYYTRTDDKGEFSFEYLKNDTFKVMVLEDINVNFLYDFIEEKVAFSDSNFILRDSLLGQPTFRLFQAVLDLNILDSSSERPGQIYMVTNKEPETLEPQILYPEGFQVTEQIIGDTLKLWFTETIDSVGVILGVDTLDFYTNPMDSVFNETKVNIRESNATKLSLAPFDSLHISFSSLISSVDTSLIVLQDKSKPPPTVQDSLVQDSLAQDSLLLDSLILGDSLNVDSLSIDSLFVNNLDSLSMDSTLVSELDSMIVDSLSVLTSDSLEMQLDSQLVYPYDYDHDLFGMSLKTNWKMNHQYEVVLYPGAIEDIYGRTNDTIIYVFSTSDTTQYGDIALTLSDLDSTSNYVIELFSGKEFVKRDVSQQTDTFQVNYLRMPLGSYNLRVIEDRDQNGLWSTGDYWNGIQPEVIKRYTLEPLRENWGLEASVSWNQVFVPEEQLEEPEEPESKSLENAPKPKSTNRPKVQGNRKGSNG